MIRGAPLDGDVLGERDSSDMGLLRGDPTPPCPLVKSGYPPLREEAPVTRDDARSRSHMWPT